MAIDWEEFETDVDVAVKAASGRTDANLAGRISSVSRLTDEEIQELFPTPADAKKLAELMSIVQSAGEYNSKINRIVKNAEHFGSVIFTLLKKFA